MRAALLAVMLLAGCAAHAPAPGADHPANPRAPTGRLAGAPAALRPGVAGYTDLPAQREPAPPTHQHHQH